MEANQILFQGIALCKCVTAVYNKMAVTLAPHILYTRHGELYLDAVTVERDGNLPRELKLGSFKVTGLTEVQISERDFEPMMGLYEPEAMLYEGTTVFAVQPLAA
jgi:hypothetical protein